MPIHIDEVNSRIEGPSPSRSGNSSESGDHSSHDVVKEELREIVRELVAEEIARLARRGAFR
jgi:hypothetical protein